MQQDHDLKHTNKSTSTKKNLRIKVMEWPCQSADLNPIDSLWQDLKRAITKGML